MIVDGFWVFSGAKRGNLVIPGQSLLRGVVHLFASSTDPPLTKHDQRSRRFPLVVDVRCLEEIPAVAKQPALPTGSPFLFFLVFGFLRGILHVGNI